MAPTKLLVLVPLLLLAGCEDENPQRDVYQSQAECLKDWKKPELCEQMPAADANAGGYHGSSFFFWGPGYFSGNRSVLYNGAAYTPTANSAASKPFVVTGKASAAARATAKGVTTISRGGFGSTAHGLSGGS